MNNKELNDIEHRTTFYDSMYEYAKTADISHYRLSVPDSVAPVIAAEFAPTNDTDLMINGNHPIQHDGKTYLPISWGEKEESAILDTDVDAVCWVRYTSGNRKGTYVSDGTVYPTETAAMRGR